MGYMDGYEVFSHQYDAAASAAAGVGGFLLVFVLLFYLLTFGLSIAVYVLQSLGMYTIAKNRGIHNPWLAWVPVGNVWVLGSISDQYQYVAKGNVRNRRKVLLGLNIAIIVAAVLMFVMAFAMGVSVGLSEDISSAAGAAVGASLAGLILLYLAMFVIALVHVVFMYIALYDLYASCEPGNATLYLVLSILFNITMAIFVFICRKKDQGMPPRRKTVAEESVPVQPETYVAEETSEPIAEPDDFEEDSEEEVPAEEPTVE